MSAGVWLIITISRWRRRRDWSWRRIVLRNVPLSLSWRSCQPTSPDLWWEQTRPSLPSKTPTESLYRLKIPPNPYNATLTRLFMIGCHRFTRSLTLTKTGGCPTPWSSSSPAPPGAVWSSTWCTRGARSTSSGISSMETEPKPSENYNRHKVNIICRWGRQRPRFLVRSWEIMRDNSYPCFLS